MMLEWLETIAITAGAIGIFVFGLWLYGIYREAMRDEHKDDYYDDWY